MPSVGGNGSDVVASAIERNIPSLFVWGASTDFRSFNGLNLGYSLENYRNNIVDVSGVLSEQFSLFTLESDVSNIFKTMHP